MMDDWRVHWYGFDDAIYLDLSAEAPMPRVAVEAARQAVEANSAPQRVAPGPESQWIFERVFGIADLLLGTIVKFVFDDCI